MDSLACADWTHSGPCLHSAQWETHAGSDIVSCPSAWGKSSGPEGQLSSADEGQSLLSPWKEAKLPRTAVDVSKWGCIAAANRFTHPDNALSMR